MNLALTVWILRVLDFSIVSTSYSNGLSACAGDNLPTLAYEIISPAGGRTLLFGGIQKG